MDLSRPLCTTPNCKLAFLLRDAKHLQEFWHECKSDPGCSLVRDQQHIDKFRHTCPDKKCTDTSEAHTLRFMHPHRTTQTLQQAVQQAQAYMRQNLEAQQAQPHKPETDHPQQLPKHFPVHRPQHPEPQQKHQPQPKPKETKATQKPAIETAVACKHGIHCLNLNLEHLQKHMHPPRPNCAKGFGCFDYAPEHRILHNHPREFYPGSTTPSSFQPPTQLQSSAKPYYPIEKSFNPSDQVSADMEDEFEQGGWWNGKEFVQDGGYDDLESEEPEFDEAAYFRFLEEEARALEEDNQENV